jgi:MoaA/NifB/PqqE/SkfB family radical SAM enzyme
LIDEVSCGMNTLKYANLLRKLLTAKLMKRRFPLIVSLTVTNRCNLRCIYCYGSYYARDIKDFSKAVWFQLIDELSRLGTELVHLEGGEPLLRDDIGAIIERVKKNGMVCRMNSNGLLVPKKINEIKGVDSLCISLDGDQESNDKNRGIGTYAKIIEGIICAKNNGLSVLTSTVLTRNNIDTGAIENVLELSKKIGFGAQFSFLYEQTATRLSNAAFYVEEPSIKKTIRKLIDYKRKGYPIFYSFPTYYNALRWPASYEQKRFTTATPPPKGFKYIPCCMGRLMCFVDGDGMVYPCGEHIGTFPAKNFREVGFKQAWEHLSNFKECITCYNTCFNEYNQVLSCRPACLWNNFINYLRYRKK